MQTEVDELTLDSLKDGSDVDMNLEYVERRLENHNIGHRHVEAVFTALEESSKDGATGEDLYSKVEGDYRVTSYHFKNTLTALSNADVVPTHNDPNTSRTRRYRPQAYERDEWRTLRAKVEKII